ncbi:MAG: S1 RNA-binding domain-containing protein [Treponema sp.]|nr:S1 RNA-binding domain-containing protein [Treponema sp.]
MQTRFEIGEAVELEIVQISDSTIFLDLNAKSEGVLDKDELADENGNVSVKEGEKIKVFFTGESHGEMRFTTKIAGENADAEMLENAWKSGIPVDGHVEKEIKGGFEIKIGSTRAFCPYSQMGFKNREEPAAYVGRHMTFIITEYKNDGKDVLVSNRQIGEKEHANKLMKLAEEIKEGQIVEGTVESIQSFGAFIDVNGFRALLPISELALDRVTDVSSVVQEGQKLTLKVIKTDWKTERVSLSLKALIKDPWESVAEKYPVGTKLEAPISRVADFGLFVKLENGVDGLLHISELEDVKASTNLKKVYSVGQTMSVVIEKVDAEQKRISLKSASSVEQDTTAEKYLSSQKEDDGETYNPFAAFLKKNK